MSLLQDGLNLFRVYPLNLPEPSTVLVKENTDCDDDSDDNEVDDDGGFCDL